MARDVEGFGGILRVINTFSTLIRTPPVCVLPVCAMPHCAMPHCGIRF